MRVASQYCSRTQAAVRRPPEYTQRTLRTFPPPTDTRRQFNHWWSRVLALLVRVRVTKNKGSRPTWVLHDCHVHMDTANTEHKKCNNFDKQIKKTDRFLRGTAVPEVLLRARISYGNSDRLSVHLSVTTRYGFKTRWDRDSGSSPYDSLVSLVSYEVIWCHWVKRFPSNEGIK